VSEDRGKRKGRGRGDEVPSEELGWIEDLRQARAQGGDLGPGSDEEPAPPPPTRTGRRGRLGGGRAESEPSRPSDLPGELPADPRGSIRGRLGGGRAESEPSRPSDLPGESPADPRGSTRERLGSRFASLRGVRGGGREPEVPAPAVSPLPPEVLTPRGGVPPTAPERPRAPRDPDQPGRHETAPPPPGRAVRGTGVAPARPVPGTGRPARPGSPGPNRPGEPGWHDLATGEKSVVEPTRRGTGEHAPVRRGTGEQAPVRRGTGEQAPVRRGTGEQAPVRRPAGEPPSIRRGTGEPPVTRPGAERPSAQRAPGRRTQLRQQVREARRFRLITLAAVAVVLLAALPAIFLIRDAAGDPVFAGLDSLAVPGWADQSHQDLASGNRWCIQTCRLRERTWRSAKATADTDKVYEQALVAAGWHQWHTAGCPTSAGTYTCWQRDEYALDLWTRDAPCDLANVAPAPGSSPSALDPSANPIPTPGTTEAPATCTGSLVTAKVANRGDPNWHR
jgi:hypothetical protein